MAGTVRAYQTCGRCGHTRIRHPRTPGGCCTGLVYQDLADLFTDPATGRVTRCTCRRFKERTT